MSTLSNIETIMKKQKKTQKDLCDFLGINGQAFTNWKNGNSKSYKKYLPEISEFLGVPVSELLEDPAPQSGIRYEHSLGVMNISVQSAEQAELMGLFEKLSSDDKKTVLNLARRLAGE